MAEAEVLVVLIGPAVAVGDAIPPKKQHTLEWFSHEGTYQDAVDALKSLGFKERLIP